MIKLEDILTEKQKSILLLAENSRFLTGLEEELAVSLVAIFEATGHLNSNQWGRVNHLARTIRRSQRVAQVVKKQPGSKKNWHQAGSFVWSRKAKKKAHIADEHGTLCKMQNGYGVAHLTNSANTLPADRALCKICASKKLAPPV